MLESYLSPYLLSYVNKYIKNIKPEDLQVSLWGGDLVLAKLDLRLDVLEKELGNLPLSFLSGQIHELKIHIPWTSLGSEPAVVTINTIQFVLKLKDSATSDTKSESTVSSRGGEEEEPSDSRTKKPKSGTSSELTPSYIQSLTRRIVNNVHIVINNLILKYVEEDIVLSVNIKSVESFAVNGAWEKAFVELALPELVLRRLCIFSDVTVCLDKRNASGKIDVYQEPVIFHWNLTTRIHMTFESLHARVANVTKISTFCEELHLSLSETQLPMYIRLVQLVLALYYGTIDAPDPGHAVKDSEVDEQLQKDPSAALSSLVEGQGNDEGWTSWAWSMVPEVFSYDEEENEEETLRQRNNEDPIISVGFYCHQGSFTFKLSDISHTSGPFASSRKLHVQPFLQLSGKGMSLEVTMQGLAFFNVQLGLSHISALGLANCTCGVDDFNITLDDDREFLPFLTCGTENVSEKEVNYLTGSLFDPICPENHGKRAMFILDQEKHHQIFGEEYGIARFGAFWSDYVFTMSLLEDKDDSDAGSYSSASGWDPIFTWREFSWKKFILSPCQVTISSSLVHRLQQLVFSAQNHEYEPYSGEKPELVDENRPVPTREQVAALEDHIPSRSTQFSLLDMDIKFLFAEHPPFTAGPNTLCEISDKEPPTSLALSQLPSLHVLLKRLDIQTTVPMYARRLVKAVSKLPVPSSDLIHQCCSHFHLKIFGLEASLILLPISESIPDSQPMVEHRLMEPVSAAAYQKTLALPVYWKNPSQVLNQTQVELPKITLKVTKPQMLLAGHLYQSWMTPTYESDWLLESSLVDDVFFATNNPVLEGSVSDVNICFTMNQIVWAATGSVQQAQVSLKEISKESPTPMMQGPEETHHLPSEGRKEEDEEDDALMSFTIQMKKDNLKEHGDDGLSAFFLNIQGIALCFDPGIFSWLTYHPKQKSSEGNQPLQHSLQHQLSHDSFQDNQGSTSPRKKLSRPLPKLQSLTDLQSIPEEVQEGPGTFVKKQLYSLSEKLRQIIVQVNIQPAILIVLADTINVRPNGKITDILVPASLEEVRHLFAVRMPSLDIISSGHQHIEVSQDIPLDKTTLSQDAGSKFPWTVKADSFEIFTVSRNVEPRFHLLEPLAIASTVALNSHVDEDSAVPSVGIVVHTDMPGIQLNCSHEQVELLGKLCEQLTSHLPKIVDTFSLRPKWVAKSPGNLPRSLSTTNPRSVTKSSITSSEHLQDIPITVSSPVESISRDGVEDAEEYSDHPSIRLSLWIQWTVDKVGVSLITKKSEETGKRVKLSAVMEDLTTSVDYQDIFSKVTCKVGSLNIRHFEESVENSWKPGCYKGILFTSSHTLTKSLDSPEVSPRSPNLSRTRSLLRKSEHKFTDSKQSHSFFSLIWTRAKGISVSKRLEGKDVPWETSAKQKQFVNEFIVSMQPVDLVIWCPVIAEMLNTIQLSEAASPPTEESSGTIQIQTPTPARAKPIIQTTPKTSHHKLRSTDTQSHSKAPSTTVSSFDKWFTSSFLPLLYFDIQEVRCFLPVQKYRDQSESTEMDLFLFKVSHVKLVPYADNPLSRMVMKKELFRKAQQIKGKPGTPMEDRQYQLDVSNLGLFTASWKDISRITEEEKRSTDPDIVASQNPALEWNTSPPNQNESVVHLNPVVQEFSICCIAAPAITVNRSNADRSSSKPVIVCGHSVEANIASDLSLYLSLNNITMAQNLTANNFGALAKCFPSQMRADEVVQGGPCHHTKHRHSRADSGFDSDVSHRSHDYQQDMVRQPNPTVDFTKVVKQKYKALPVKQQVKTTGQARKIIPFDLLLTGREISVFLFSRGEKDAVCPFLLSQFSQPSFAASVSKKQQKLELSLYNLRVCGSSQKEINENLPSTTDFFVPWLETSLGEPNAKTGVRPALLTLTVSDFLTVDGAISVDVGRPVKVNFSIDKGEEAYNFVEKIRSKFQRKRQVWPQLERMGTDVQNNPFASGLPIQETKESSSDESKGKLPDPLGPLAVIKNYSLATSHCDIAIATGPGQENPQVLFSIAGVIGNMKVHPNIQGLTKDLHLSVCIDGMAMKTGLNNMMRPLVGPVTYDCDTMVQLLHSDLTITKTVCHMSIGHVPVTLGQEHVNCLTALVTSYRAFFQLDQKDVPVPSMQQTERKSSRPSVTPDPIHSKDDLRSESFVYVTDSASEQPCPNEIQFQPGGSGTTHDGTMTWRYPEPRVLTRITMTPIPLRTATNVTDDDDLSDVPCSLEYWDDMDCCFHHYKDLFVSEANTYHVSMGLGQRSIGSDGAVAACLWRMVLNPGSDKRKRNLLAEQNIILTPMALAASLRVDSCFSPVFIPTTSLALKVGLVDVHLVNHLSQCGRAIPEKLLPFTFDDTEPLDQEFCTVSLLESTLSTQLWKIPSTAIKMKMQTNLKASVLNYSQLTMVPLINNVQLEGNVMVDQADGGCLIEMDTSDFNMRIGQGSIHVLTGALQSWINNKQPEAEQVVPVYYILSNNTNVTLRLGQVDTDEVIVLHPRKMHQYCWRSHKRGQQLLHLGIDDLNCPYWSGPFDIGGQNSTASCSIKHNGKEATIFVEVKAMSSLQRQVIFHAQQSFINHLTIPIEVHLQISQNPHRRKDHPLGYLNEEGSRQLEDALRSEGTPDCDPGSSEEVTSSSGVDSESKEGDTADGNSDWFLSIDADSSHPSLLVDEADIVGIRVKLRDEQSDWSEQFAVAGEMMREKFVAEVPRLNKSSVYFCCSILEEVHDGRTQRAILFSPSFWIHNFLPHSLMMNLTCKRNPSLQMKEVDGFGVMTPLYHLNPASPYFATFQLTSDTAPSSPSIPISFESDAFVVLPKEPLKISDLLFLSTEKSARNSWPFELEDFSQSNSTRQTKRPIISHPDTDLNIHLSQDWSHVDSLVINVEPWCLIANATEWDVIISDVGGMNCYISSGTTIAPPKFQGEFNLTITQKENTGTTEMVTLQDEKISPFMRPDQMEKKQLFIDGYVSLEIPFHSEGSEDCEVCYLVVQSEIKEKVRFIKIQPKVIILNDQDSAVALRAVEYGNLEKISYTSLKHVERTTVRPNSTSSAIVWKRFNSDLKNKRQSPWQRSISIALININSTSDIVTPSGRSWSKWIHLDTTVARQSIPVPVEQPCVMQFATRPFVAVMQEEKGVVYISLAIDPCPRMAVTNLCPFPLQLAQAVPGKPLAGCKVLEDTQLLPECNIVPPQQMAHYSYQTSSRDSEPVRICLAVAPYFSAVQLPENNSTAVKMEPDWTDPIAIATTSSPLSEITALSTGSYVLVASHLTGSQTSISIELLSMESLTNGKSDKQMQKEEPEKTDQATRSFQNMKAKIFFKSVTLSLINEVQNALKFVEILRLHAEGIHFLSYPKPYNDRKGQLQMFNISVKSAQVDNQAYTSGRYDFPVIFKGKSRVTSVKKEVNGANFTEMSDYLQEESFMAVCISTEVAGSAKSVGWDDLTIHFNDAEVFIEDQFIFDMLHFSQLFPIVALKHHGTQIGGDPLPRNVRASLSALKGPISIQHLTIEPITLLASVHASMKFFIAVDRTLLTFGQFQTGPVFATISQLGQALSLHYTSGAIFKAGWVLGSLEILGNPAGLLRSVSSGLADTILLPYEGLIRGPTAFISGVAGGLSSLVWQVTAGTLTSITKFAASVSRNLDRLSLDQDHLLRQETARRRIPHGPREGITQGLSHFGISLLGAIAGIADQPIRGFQKSGSAEGETHAGEQAKEVISGLGKGLVGAVVKPIGGAAELVSQTGQGILHGTGLAEFPKQLSIQHIELRAKFPNSKLKYSWKMFVNIPKPEILMLTKVTSVTNQGLHHAAALILTPEMLFVISISEDSAQQAFPLVQTDCFALGESEEGVRFKVKGATSPLTSPEVPETSDLIADFVDVSSSFVGSMDEIPNTSLESPPEDEDDKEEIPLKMDSWTFTFFMNRYLRVTFLSVFQEAKKQLPKDRFLSKSF